jgi:hypothetical protein
VVADLEMDLDIDDATPRQRKLVKTLGEFGGYIGANAEWIPNYGERYRYGEAISNAFVESAVNKVVSKRMVKKQQMGWSPRGAHLLLQTRTRCSTTTSPVTSAAGIRLSCRRQTDRTWRRDLPYFVPLSYRWSPEPKGTEVVLVQAGRGTPQGG